MGYLIHGETTDCISRLHIILEDGPSRPFEPFDMNAQFHESAGKPFAILLDDFTALRRDNVASLRAGN